MLYLLASRCSRADQDAGVPSVKAANAAARTARPQIRTFSILIGALFVPIVTQWVANLEEVHFISTTYLSVFFHAILILAALAGFNALLRLVAPRYSFHRAELLVVFIMLGVSGGIVGDQFMAVLIPSLTTPFRYATEANLWAQNLWPHLPQWAMVSDAEAVQNFYEGSSTLYRAANFKPWLGPGLIWASFIAVTQLMCLGINIVMRRQWTEYERLSFPLIQLPLGITAPGRQSIWRNQLMWLGGQVTGYALCRAQNISGRHSVRARPYSGGFHGGRFWAVLAVITREPQYTFWT